jgi:hypothetical protein
MFLVVFSMAFVKDKAGMTFLFAQIILKLILSTLVWFITYHRSSGYGMK